MTRYKFFNRRPRRSYTNAGDSLHYSHDRTLDFRQSDKELDALDLLVRSGALAHRVTTPRNPAEHNGRRCNTRGDWHMEMQLITPPWHPSPTGGPCGNEYEGMWRFKLFSEHNIHDYGETQLSLSLSAMGRYVYKGAATTYGKSRRRPHAGEPPRSALIIVEFATLLYEEFEVWQKAAGETRLGSSMNSYEWCCAVMDKAIEKGAFTVQEKARVLERVAYSLYQYTDPTTPRPTMGANFATPRPTLQANAESAFW